MITRLLITVPVRLVNVRHIVMLIVGAILGRILFGAAGRGGVVINAVLAGLGRESLALGLLGIGVQ